MNFWARSSLTGQVAVVFAFLAQSSAFAMIGDGIRYASESKNPSVCHIEIRNPNPYVRIGNCTGTLVNSNTVYTAGHCFGRKFALSRHSTVSVRCGGHYAGNAAAVSLPDVTDDSLWQSVEADLSDDPGHPYPAEIPFEKDDFAVLKLERDVPAAPPNKPSAFSPVATGPALYFESSGLMKMGVVCTMMGYGMTDIENGEAKTQGYLVEADLAKSNVYYSTQNSTIILKADWDKSSLVMSADSGDSGGPLFCTAPGGNPELVGTIVKYRIDRETQLRKSNVFRPVWPAVY